MGPPVAKSGVRQVMVGNVSATQSARRTKASLSVHVRTGLNVLRGDGIRVASTPHDQDDTQSD